MTGLMILNTRNMPRNKVVASEKLNGSCVKRGKPIIPPYDRIDSSPYVTAILSRQDRVAGAKGGTHASPMMHIRRGHIRNYASGERRFISDTLVNATEDMRKQFVSQRSHYVVKDSE